MKSLHRSGPNVLTDQRILEIDDFGVGFFAPQDNLRGSDQTIFRLFFSYQGMNDVFFPGGDPET